MSVVNGSGRRMTVLMGACLAGLLISVALWLINLELAIRVFAPEWRLVERLLPAAWFGFGQAFAADLSTISTLVPVLLFAFPLVQGWRVRRAQPHDPEFAMHLEADPYPPHFAFFLVMLGLVGTLYGLMIGLDLSGVSDLAGEPLSQDAIRRSLDRLLGGTATALLSSLVGILGAFVAARPMAWLFRRAAGLQPDALRRGLSETVTQLTGDLYALGEASRSFAALLNPDTAQSFFARMEAQRAELEALGNRTAETNARLERLETVVAAGAKALAEAATAMRGDLQRAAQAAEDTVARLAALEGEVQAGNRQLAILGSSAAEGYRQREGLAAAFAESNRQLAAARADAAAHHAAGMETAVALLGETRAGRECLEQDRESRRKALAAYIRDAAEPAQE